MNYLHLFIEFFKIGIFSFGGGYATLPFLYHIAEKYEWYTSSDLTQMLAISSITPGPVGINVATFAGFVTAGIVGSLIATTAVALPSFLIVTAVSKIINKYRENKYIQGALRGIKASGCALLSYVGIKLLFTSKLELIGSIILVGLILFSLKQKRGAIFYLSITALLGFILGYFNLIGV